MTIEFQSSPRGAIGEPEITNPLRQEGVDKINADQCQLGQQTDSGDPLKKPIGFMSNAPHLLNKLNRRCFGRHGICSRPQGGRHVECLGKKAQQAGIFQEELCIAILRGFKDQLFRDRRMRNGKLSMVDIDGIMIDGDDEVNDYYAGIVSSSISPHPTSVVGLDRHPQDISISSSQNSSGCCAEPSRFKSAAQNRGTDGLGTWIAPNQVDPFSVSCRKTSSPVTLVLCSQIARRARTHSPYVSACRMTDLSTPTLDFFLTKDCVELHDGRK